MSRILIIDDEPDVLELLREHLEGEHEVETALDGAKGLSALLARRPDVVFLDIMMPGMSGFGVLDVLREIDATLPVVVMTASEQTSMAEEMIKRGVFSFVPKPFDLRYVDHLVSMLPV